MRVGYADPPYLGCCALYGHDHREPFGCWDDPNTHKDLAQQLALFDGWVLHLSSPSLQMYLTEVLYCYFMPDDYRVMAWVKPFAAFMANVPVAYAWEPVIVKPCRKQVVAQRMVMRDWIAEPITLERGTVGAKPERVCMWAFEMLGLQRDDELVDLFPGSGAVTRAWEKWKSQLDFSDRAEVARAPE